jgi:hypothetical protein
VKRKENTGEVKSAAGRHRTRNLRKRVLGLQLLDVLTKRGVLGLQLLDSVLKGGDFFIAQLQLSLRLLLREGGGEARSHHSKAQRKEDKPAPPPGSGSHSQLSPWRATRFPIDQPNSRFKRSE